MSSSPSEPASWEIAVAQSWNAAPSSVVPALEFVRPSCARSTSRPVAMKVAPAWMTTPWKSPVCGVTAPERITTGLADVPLTVRAPWTTSSVRVGSWFAAWSSPGPRWTTVPASIVKVTPAGIVKSPCKTYGAPAAVQVCEKGRLPEGTLVCARAAIGSAVHTDTRSAERRTRAPRVMNPSSMPAWAGSGSLGK